MDKKTLNKIIKDHGHWLCENRKGWETMRADLHSEDLRDADLHGIDLALADLRGADLRNADLRDADLREANLCGAKLDGADLSNANLIEANLRKANLCQTNLHGAKLFQADFRRANLHDADLSDTDLFRASLHNAKLIRADLRNACLNEADLTKADLLGADLRDANLDNAHMNKAKNIQFIPMVCPKSGEFTGWKQTRNGIVELVIPKDADRLSGTGRMCRCNKAFVRSIEDKDGNIHTDPLDEFRARSFFDWNFIYRVGEIVTVEDFDQNRFNQYAPGIHFFMTREEAVEYTR